MGLCFLKNTSTHFCNENYMIHIFQFYLSNIQAFHAEDNINGS